jgi:hypothetical protein
MVLGRKGGEGTADRRTLLDGSFMLCAPHRTGAIESWNMDWAGRMHAREDKMTLHNVYCLRSNSLFFLRGLLVQVLLPLLAQSQFYCHCWHSHSFIAISGTVTVLLPLLAQSQLLGAFTCREMRLSA